MMRERLNEALVSWTIIPALLFCLILVPLALTTYGLSRWLLSIFDLAEGDKIAISAIISLTLVIAYAWAADWVGNTFEKRGKGRLP